MKKIEKLKSVLNDWGGRFDLEEINNSGITLYQAGRTSLVIKSFSTDGVTVDTICDEIEVCTQILEWDDIMLLEAPRSVWEEIEDAFEENDVIWEKTMKRISR